jgi:hypothetical protein
MHPAEPPRRPCKFSRSKDANYLLETLERFMMHRMHPKLCIVRELEAY